MKYEDKRIMAAAEILAKTKGNPDKFLEAMAEIVKENNEKEEEDLEDFEGW